MGNEHARCRKLEIMPDTLAQSVFFWRALIPPAADSVGLPVASPRPHEASGLFTRIPHAGLEIQPPLRQKLLANSQ